MLGIYHPPLRSEPRLETCSEGRRGVDPRKIPRKQKPATQGSVSGGAGPTAPDVRHDGRQVRRRQLMIHICAVLLAKRSAVHLAGVGRYGTPSAAFRFPPPTTPLPDGPHSSCRPRVTRFPIRTASSPPTPAVSYSPFTFTCTFTFTFTCTFTCTCTQRSDGSMISAKEFRARFNRDFTVPRLQCVISLISSYERPSSSRSTNTSRWCSGRAATEASTI